MNKTLKIYIASTILTSLLSVEASAQILPDRPTMGWSSWNTFGVNISEKTIKEQADAMLAQGLLDVGFNHINIDDGYFGGRDNQGNLLIHPSRFPNGLKPVVDYIHEKGMKAGIYSDGGKNTCGSMFNGDVTGKGVGFYGHDQQDCDFFFKDMGFDFIKVDFCGGSPGHNEDHLSLDEEERYTAIANAIKNTGRTDVRLNICRWDYPGNWAHDIATSWRTTFDINSSWGSIQSIIKENLYLSAYCYDGHYNDMDMLEVGRSLSAIEDRTHFGMWCIMSSPLLIGCDMKHLNTAALNLLRNKEIIALNQDDLCIQAYVVQHVGDTYVLVKDFGELYGKTRVVALYNSGDRRAEITIPFADLDLAGTVKVRDLFSHKDLEDMTDKLTVRLPAHYTYIYRLDAETRLERTLYEAETAYLSKYTEIKNNQQYHSGIYEANEACSGREYVTWLGADPKNDLQWRHVYSDQGGTYTMKINYISGESRSMTVNVNGKDVKTLTGCNSGDWGTVGTKTLGIELQPGENVIRLYNKSSSAWMPNIDCMTIQPQGTTERIAVGIEAPTAIPSSTINDGKYYTLDGILVKKPRRGGLYIFNGKKVIFRD